jgi:hypothetical protein
VQGPGIGKWGSSESLSKRPEPGFKQEFDEPKKKEKSGDSSLDKMIEKLKNQLEILEQLKSSGS